MKRLGLLFVVSLIITMQATAQTAVIREMTGTVELKSGGADWVSAKAGDVIQKAMMISTGFKSTAILSVGSSTITVRPLTRLSLEELINQDETETINLGLSTGRVRVEVNPPAGSRANFNVQTPSSTASVRGTSFEMDTVSIRVLTGAVSYSPVSTIARPVTVSAGSETWINPDTGIIQTPMIASQVTRSLPSLPGQTTGAAAGAIILHSGNLSIDVELGTNE
jgi:hypothetical protein